MSEQQDPSRRQKQLQDLYGACAVTICGITGAGLGLDLFQTRQVVASPDELIIRVVEMYAMASLLAGTIVFHDTISRKAGKWCYRRFHGPQGL